MVEYKISNQAQILFVGIPGGRAARASLGNIVPEASIPPSGAMNFPLADLVSRSHDQNHARCRPHKPVANRQALITLLIG
jgi:hypothetical protein